MLDSEYFPKGLRGLAQAHQAGGLAGHLGAAVLAGYLFAKDHPDLDPKVYQHHVRLWRSLPDVSDEFGPVERAQHDPRTAQYWTTGDLRRDSAMLTHRIKTLYGFFTLLRLIEDAATRKKAEEEFFYLMT